jgi:3-oxoacyl-[acyl-carrier protein] reductase
MSVDYEIAGRVAIVCGASTGMGFSSAMGLAKQGVNLLLISRSEEKLQSAKADISAQSDVDIEILPGSVSDPKLAQEAGDIALKTWNKVDVLLNNAGGPPMGSFLEQDDAAWSEALDLSLMSVVRFTRVVAPLMMERKWGRIINITSTLAKEPSGPMVLSATARAGVSAFSKSISIELAENNVTINTLCPGGVLTGRLRSLVEISAKNQNKDYDEVLKASESSIPLGRFADPEEFADMVVFLASERGRYLTGTTTMVDGGLTKSVF